MNRRSLPLTLFVGVVLVLGLTVLNRAQSASPARAAGGGVFSTIRTDDTVTVTLRGDRLGLAFHERSTEGFLFTRKGKIASVDEKWLVVENNEQRSVIPLDSIVLIDIAK